jgi:hypothetical protein
MLLLSGENLYFGPSGLTKQKALSGRRSSPRASGLVQLPSGGEIIVGSSAHQTIIGGVTFSEQGRTTMYFAAMYTPQDGKSWGNRRSGMKAVWRDRGIGQPAIHTVGGPGSSYLVFPQSTSITPYCSISFRTLLDLILLSFELEKSLPTHSEC